MDDVIGKIKNKFVLLRQEPEFSLLSEKEWIAFQIDYITKNMGHNDLRCVERSDYFKKIVQQCVGVDEIKKHFVSNGITYFDENGKYTATVQTTLGNDTEDMEFPVIPCPGTVLKVTRVSYGKIG